MDPRPTSDVLPLRERKKLQTMRRIQSVALDLVESVGFDAVTVEAIAAGADVSPSTVYRYFETKEGVFLWDEFDALVIAAFDAALGALGPVEAMRHAFHSVLGREMGPERPRLLRHLDVIFSEPALEHAMRREVDSIRAALAAVLAGHLRRPQSDLDVNVVAAAITGALFAAIEVWARKDGRELLTDLLDDAVDVLARGVVIEGAP